MRHGIVSGGVSCLQLRLKQVSTSDFVHWAEKASKIDIGMNINGY